MTFRTTFLIAVLALVGIFAAINWSAFLTPTALSLVFTDFQAPLGLVMLGIVIALSAIFLLYILAQQTSVLLDNRRLTRQLESQRDLAGSGRKIPVYRIARVSAGRIATTATTQRWLSVGIDRQTGGAGTGSEPPRRAN